VYTAGVEIWRTPRGVTGEEQREASALKVGKSRRVDREEQPRARQLITRHEKKPWQAGSIKKRATLIHRLFVFNLGGQVGLIRPLNPLLQPG